MCTSHASGGLVDKEALKKVYNALGANRRGTVSFKDLARLVYCCHYRCRFLTDCFVRTSALVNAQPSMPQCRPLFGRY